MHTWNHAPGSIIIRGGCHFCITLAEFGLFVWYITSVLSVVLTFWFAEDLAGLKIRHGLDKVMEGGAVVLTLKDTNVLAEGDVNDGEYIL